MSVASELFGVLSSMLNEAVRLRPDGSPAEYEVAMLRGRIYGAVHGCKWTTITSRLFVVSLGEVAYALQWRGDSWDINAMTREAVEDGQQGGL